jgi:exodeoxyribonuclease VII small subunit
MKQGTDTAKALDLETALKELETVIEELERGDLSLEAALKRFEHGIALTRHCQESLKAAEQKVEILLGKDGQEVLETFEPEK